jgi:hypothetical protein
MAWRFRKRLKLLPGIVLNLSKRGGSLSFGGHGLTTNISRRGIKETVGLPGTGISYQTNTYRPGKSRTVHPGHRPRRHGPGPRRLHPAITVWQALVILAGLLFILWLLAH